MTERLTEATTEEEIWEEVEDCFYSLYKDVKHRCYPKQDIVGARYIEVLARRHLSRIDYLLLHLDQRAKKERSEVR